MTTTAQPIPERVAKLEEIDLLSGGHKPPPATCDHPEGCAKELAAWVRGLEWSDDPDPDSRVVSAFLRRLNDGLPHDLRQELKPLLIGPQGRLDDGFEEERAWMAADWAIRTALPTWLDLAGVKDSPEQLRNLPPITASSIAEQRPLLRDLRDQMREKRKVAIADLTERVRQELLKRGLSEKGAAADAVADAAADAVAVAVAVAAAVADYRRYGSVWNAVYKAVKPKMVEKYGPVNAAVLPSAIELVQRMVALGDESEAV